MSCPRLTLVSAYMDNELQDADKTAFEVHLRGCVQCSTALLEMKSLRSAFAQAERHQAPPGFAARVMARAAELDRKNSPWIVPLSVRFAEAAFLLVVITVGILAGTIMMTGSTATKSADIASTFFLDVFDPAPPGSLGGAYLAMTEVRNEK